MMDENREIYVMNYDKANQLQSDLGFTNEQMANVLYGKACIAIKSIAANEKGITPGQYITTKQYVCLNDLSLSYACGWGISGIYKALAKKDGDLLASKYFTRHRIDEFLNQSGVNGCYFLTETLRRISQDAQTERSEKLKCGIEIEINDIYNNKSIRDLYQVR